MIRRPPRSTQSRSSAASDVYKRQHVDRVNAGPGNDSIVAVGTRARARINCGSGVDTVRIVPAERRFLKGCERVLIVRRAHETKANLVCRLLLEKKKKQ